jgi:hypothetical protein
MNTYIIDGRFTLCFKATLIRNGTSILLESQITEPYGTPLITPKGSLRSFNTSDLIKTFNSSKNEKERETVRV